jgi:hypothetical protein
MRLEVLPALAGELSGVLDILKSLVGHIGRIDGPATEGEGRCVSRGPPLEHVGPVRVGRKGTYYLGGL